MVTVKVTTSKGSLYPIGGLKLIGDLIVTISVWWWPIPHRGIETKNETDAA